MSHKEFWKIVLAVIVAQIIFGAAVVLINKKVKGPSVPGGMHA